MQGILYAYEFLFQNMVFLLFAIITVMTLMQHTFASRFRLLILLISVRCPSSRSTLRHLNYIRLLTNNEV